MRKRWIVAAASFVQLLVLAITGCNGRVPNNPSSKSNDTPVQRNSASQHVEPSHHIFLSKEERASLEVYKFQEEMFCDTGVMSAETAFIKKHNDALKELYSIGKRMSDENEKLAQKFASLLTRVHAFPSLEDSLKQFREVANECNEEIVVGMPNVGALKAWKVQHDIKFNSAWSKFRTEMELIPSL